MLAPSVCPAEPADLDDQDLHDDRAGDDQEEDGLRRYARKRVPLVVELPAVELVEYLHRRATPDGRNEQHATQQGYL